MEFNQPMENKQIKTTGTVELTVDKTARRKTYTAPRLEVLGAVTERTGGISGGLGESGSSATKRDEF